MGKVNGPKGSGSAAKQASKGMSRRRWLLGAGAVALGGAGVYLATTSLLARPHEYTYQIVNRYPHDPNAFTQGLVYYADDILYEGTGLEDGQSRLRKLRLQNADEPLQEIHLPDRDFFGEGIALWNDTIIQLTWRNHVVYVYDRDSFHELRRFDNPREGWGLTHDGRHLIMSDGSSTVTFHNPDTFQVVRELPVHDAGQPVRKLNELEFIEGEIYANVWETDYIVRISPATGEVVARLDLTGLRPHSTLGDLGAVLNGIAYDPTGRRLFVTGKDWPELFEIRQVPK
jgi:glutamine cyclotransferase